MTLKGEKKQKTQNTKIQMKVKRKFYAIDIVYLESEKFNIILAIAISFALSL